jgi:Fe-S cluster biosynthesis and repair protein YggX
MEVRMTNVTCSRCGSTAAGLDDPPLPGEPGRLVHGQTCAACWKEWMGMQVILMNERRLSPGDPAHYELLIGEMKTFLNLHEG